MKLSKTTIKKINKELVEKYWDEHPCESGGLGFPEGSREFFEEMEERRYREYDFIHAFAQFTRWQGKRVLEVGCGCGTDLLQFARAGAKVYGVDLSQRSIELTIKHLGNYGLQSEVRRVDGYYLPFPSNYFDLVYSWGVLQHSPDPQKAFEEIYRVLKPGAYIKVMVYSRRSPIWLGMCFKHALLKGRIFTSLSQIISERMESPGTRAFTMKEIKDLFQPFSHLRFKPIPVTEINFLNKYWFLSWLANFYPSCLSMFVTVEGQKPVENRKNETSVYP